MIDIPAWTAFRSETGIPVLVDAAAAFDAMADASLPAVISLHATKALGIGEGGVFVTQDEALAQRVRELTNFGFRGSRTAHAPAVNAKISEYAAAVGHAALDLWPSTRLRYLMMGQRLRMSLLHSPQVRFQAGWASEWVSSVCVVNVPHGAAPHIEAHLAGEDIETRRWWSDGCHTHPAFAGCKRGDLSATDRLARSTLGLPFSLDMDAGHIIRVAGALSRAVEAL
jgi:dTDP-4-amino-4,6-dideoxygalactose transaminase